MLNKVQDCLMGILGHENSTPQKFLPFLSNSSFESITFLLLPLLSVNLKLFNISSIPFNLFSFKRCKEVQTKMNKKIAVIGAGLAGITFASIMKDKFNVKIFEKSRSCNCFSVNCKRWGNAS